MRQENAWEGMSGQHYKWLMKSLLSLGQVWAVGEDRGLYFRMGVTPSEPSGNGWIPVSAQWGNSRELVLPRCV